MLGKLGDVWGRWRERRRQYQLERALYKAGGHQTGQDAGRQMAIDNENLRDAGVDARAK